MYQTRFGGLVKLEKENKRYTTIYVKIRDFYNYESKLTWEQLQLFPNITNINPNSKKQRKRKKDKDKKDKIICYPFCQTEYGQNAGVTELSKPKEIYSHVLKKKIVARYDAASISHRLESIYDFLHGDYKTPILYSAIQKEDLKELQDYYKDPDTNESIPITNMTAREIFLESEEAKNDYLDYEMAVVIQSSKLSSSTISRNNKWLNMGGGFESWEAFRTSQNETIDYISEFSFQTNEEENDQGVHPLYRLENNLEVDKPDKGLILKNDIDKNASYFEGACYLFSEGLSAVKNKPLSQWPRLTERKVQDKIISINNPSDKIKAWLKRTNDNGVDFFNAIGDKKSDLPKDFISLHLITYIIYDIEQKFKGQFKLSENDWAKFANRINNICKTLKNSTGVVQDKTWKPSAASELTYEIHRYRTKANLLNFGLRLVLDELYNTTKEDLGLTELGVIVKPLQGLSADDKREIISRQTEGLEIICDISDKPYPIEDLEYCHIEAESFGLLNSTQVNEPKNIRLAHRRYNRMMGTMNYTAFKEHYKSNSKTIDRVLVLDK